MKTQLIAVAAALAIASIAGPADAKGCLKGAAVGGAAGHVAGHHGLLGAGAGCLVGRHRANKAAKQQAAQQQEQSVAPASPPAARDKTHG
jgi:hypothetical protein